MHIIVTLLTASVLLLIASGLYFTLYPQQVEAAQSQRLKGSIGINLVLFASGITVLLYIITQDVMASVEATQESREITIGFGLALIGIGLPTAFATIGAGIAVSSVGAASLAVITEKPELFGRTLIYLGLAEGIAIYGLVVTILLLGKI
ncbi:MAG: ATPase [Gammaproteobacteria bacterium]|nr:ATPase [Gammaproteobacteria bacterium]MBT7141454.1 ATPase [Gammaproteobacteria bacterium]